MEREPRASEAGPAAAALFAWGANSYGQLGLGHKEDVLLPQQLNDFCKPGCVRRITGGGGHSAVVTDGGSLFVCGLNKDGQLGLGHTEDVLYFTPCRSLLGCPIQQVACGWDFTIILTGNGQVLSCGSNSFGQLGVPHGPRRCVVPQAIEPLREKVVSIAAGLRHALAATASGIVFQWGTGLASSGRRLCPGETLPLFLTAKEPSRVTETGKVFTWGRADYGQLGRKLESHENWRLDMQGLSLPCPRPQKSTPSPLHCLTGATEVSCGSEHNLAVIGGEGPASCPSSCVLLVGLVIPGAGTSMACAGMAPKPTSGPRSPCSLCGCRQVSLWAAGLATPWPSVSCQPFLHWTRAPRSLALPQMPLKMPNLRKPWIKRNWKERQPEFLPKASLTRAEMGGL
ncbi:secretion-regulating guanine nucleotide exchange factor isoform X27 [Equus przewalskii]|uniref:Secretion-regulating guanine nucleotide exchange factor isoform X27 n=1 Tax=Equus przewalskii TaxID=9798 RepID=A0ABM4PTL6_EQUPR